MNLTVLGGWGAFPGPDGACSGYVLESDDFRVLIDPGYSTFSKLIGLVPASSINAVLISHGHPDHCADLNPLLRSRALQDDNLEPLPVYSLPGALDEVLSLDHPGMLERSYILKEFHGAESFRIGPFLVTPFPLPHFVPNSGFRITDQRSIFSFTGDSGPDSALVEMSEESDVFLAETTYTDEVGEGYRKFLNSALNIGRIAQESRVKSLVLTHFWPGTDPEEYVFEARKEYSGPVHAATYGLSMDF